MEIASLDPDWMAKALADALVNLSYFREGKDDDKSDHSLILTAPTKDLEAFLQTYGDDPEAFGESEIYHRVR